MKKMRKDIRSIPVLLMTSSILLLLVLQGFWLRSAYRDAANQFRKETNFLFRNTVFAMQDSLIQRSIEPITPDSLKKFGHPKRYFFNDSIKFRVHDRAPIDCVFNYIKVTETAGRVEIFSSGNPDDSLQRILRPLVSKLQAEKKPKNFIIRLGPDSLRTDSIHYYYEQALDKAGINMRFRVIALKGERPGRHADFPGQRGEFVSEAVPINPISRYAVTFMGIEGFLLKEIAPQILFSIFLSVLTIVSFYIMYRSLRAQERLMDIKNDFISNITHELKTPVATVSVALEAIRNFHVLENPKRTEEYLEIAQNELNRLTLMTDKILKTAVFENRGVELMLETMSLDDLIQEILNSMKLVFEKRHVRLSYRKEGTDFTMQGSREHLSNVLYNLIDNALKYGRDQIAIDIVLTSDPHNLNLTVADNGIGIAAEYQKKIFEKFFRVPSGDIHTVKGYGLGLSYVKSVVALHGGDVSVESETGKGSSFQLKLPRNLNERSIGRPQI